MWSDEQFEKLEEEERSHTNEAILAMSLVINNAKDDIEKELQSFYQKYGKDGVITYQEARKWVSEQDRRRRMTVLYLTIGGIFATTLIKLSPKFENFLKDIVKMEGDFFDIDVDPLEVIYKKWGVDGLNWLDRLDDDIDLWTRVILNDLKKSFLRKDNLKDVMDQVNKRFDNIQRVLDRLGITESTAIGTMARREVFKELGIKKYRFYTRADERTCEQCGGLHGLIFPISAYEVGVTASPIHPRCRCWEVPIVD